MFLFYSGHYTQDEPLSEKDQSCDVKRKGKDWIFRNISSTSYRCKRKMYLPILLASVVTAKRNTAAKMNMHFMFMTEVHPCGRNYFSKLHKLEILGQFSHYLICFHLVSRYIQIQTFFYIIQYTDVDRSFR